MSAFEQAKQTKLIHTTVILGKPNVVGLGVGYRVAGNRVTDELGVVVLVRNKVPLAGLPSEAVVPRELDGVRTDVIEVGDLRPLQVPTDRWRPAPGGVSIGHYKITAGTLGCIVRDRQTGARLILSNNHVLGNSNDASPGDPILQPGTADGGRVESDTIAYLARFCPLQFNSAPPTCNLAMGYVRVGNAIARLTKSSHQVQALRLNPLAANQVDAAVARPVDDNSLRDDVLNIGTPDGVTQASLGMGVRKMGRTTSFTTGDVLVINATVTVGYGFDRAATFDDQIVTSPMSRGGDSGSLLMAGDAMLAVGLLFAGSDQATIHNPIQAVQDCLDIDITSSAAYSKTLENHMTIERIQQVKESHQAWLLSRPHVVGVGTGLRHKDGKRTSELVLVVMVDKKVPSILLSEQDLIPSEIDGVPVDVKEVGGIKAQ